jgi:hypothetical protein
MLKANAQDWKEAAMETATRPQVQERQAEVSTPDPPYSPGRAAAELELRGWRVMIPFLHVFGALMGLAGLIGALSGLAMRTWLISVATEIDPEAVVAKPGTPGIAYAIVGISACLVVWGLVGIARGERQERMREELLRRAERLQERRTRRQTAPELEHARLAG